MVTLTEYTIINGRKASHRFECNYSVSTQNEIEKIKQDVEKMHGLEKLNRNIEDKKNRYRVLFTIKKPKGCHLHT